MASGLRVFVRSVADLREETCTGGLFKKIVESSKIQRKTTVKYIDTSHLTRHIPNDIKQESGKESVQGPATLGQYP